MFFEYGRWKDGLWGIELEFTRQKWLTTIVYEFMSSTDQSGPIYNDSTEKIPDQISGADDYYNHGAFNGWQHKGYSIATPLILSPAYNRDRNIIFKSTRAKVHHWGITGEPFNDWNYRVLCSHMRNWGTYKAPYPEIKKNFSALFEIMFHPDKLNGYCFTGTFAFDKGTLVGDNAGVMFSVRKVGEFKFRKR